MRLGRARILAASAAITTLAGAFAAAAIPAANAAASAASAAPMALSASAATPLPAAAVRLGAMPAQSRLTVDVALNIRDEAGLDALLNGVANPKSPYFRDFLRKGQFGPRFGLTQGQLGQVTSALRSLGLDPGQVDAARLDIPVTATAAAIDRAFGLTLEDYRLPGGRVAYANSAAPRVPAAIAPYIEGILGLDNVYLAQRQDESVPATSEAAETKSAGPAVAGPTVAAASGALDAPRLTMPAAVPAPCTDATDTAISFNGFTADQLAEHYEMRPLYAMGDLGAGVHVAVAELEPNLTTDINNYKTCYGITTQVNDITVDSGLGAGAGSGEAALDIEDIAGLAPKSVIDVYQAPNTKITGLLDIATRVLNLDKDRVLSISWGLCEAEAGSSLLAHYQTVFKALNAQGITVVASAGDTGSTGCYISGGTKKAPALSPVSPATSNYVISVGGTSMKTAGPLTSETAWNGTGTSNPGAGGGGVSVLCMPNYQDLNQNNAAFPPITGLISARSRKSAPCAHPSGNRHGYLRQVPDVSANATGAHPYVVFYNGAWTGFFGTSGSTTLVAAEAALIDASPYCSARGWNSGAAGLLPQGLYGTVSVNDLLVYLSSGPAVVRDITSGNTDDKASGYTGGLYPATKGYDMATGLGTPLLTAAVLPTFNPGMAVNMCHWFAAPGRSDVSTASVSPASAKAGRAVTVTVHGTGLLAIANTDAAEINNGANTRQLTEVWANCSSHTSCKVTIPGEKAGTYRIEMLAADFLPCLHCKASVTFKFAAPPHISGLSTHNGHRGTKVTVHGSNFIGVHAVYFGGRKGTSVTVISPTELTVIAPAGSGTVQVKVVAAGGTSNAGGFTY